MEERLIQELAKRFFAGMGEDLVSIIFFSSAARGEERAGSDIDLILVVKDGSDLDRLDDKVSEISLEAAAAFAGLISPILLTETAYANKKRSRNAFWRTVLEEGIELALEEEE